MPPAGWKKLRRGSNSNQSESMLRLIFFIAWLLAPLAALSAVQPIAAFTPGARLLFLDAAGNLTNLTSSTSGGASAGYQFDALNRLTNVIDQRLTGTKNTALHL